MKHSDYQRILNETSKLYEGCVRDAYHIVKAQYTTGIALDHPEAVVQLACAMADTIREKVVEAKATANPPEK